MDTQATDNIYRRGNAGIALSGLGQRCRGSVDLHGMRAMATEVMLHCVRQDTVRDFKDHILSSSMFMITIAAKRVRGRIFDLDCSSTHNRLISSA
jgi:hypothetical protein